MLRLVNISIKLIDLADWLKDPIWRHTDPDWVGPDPHLAFLSAINKLN